jgi:hypothetical protein
MEEKQHRNFHHDEGKDEKHHGDGPGHHRHPHMRADSKAEDYAHHGHGHGHCSKLTAPLASDSADDDAEADAEFERLKRAPDVVQPDVDRTRFAQRFVRGFRM